MNDPFDPPAPGSLENATPPILVAFLTSGVGFVSIFLVIEFVDRPAMTALAVAGILLAIGGGLAAIGFALRRPAGTSWIGLLFGVGATLFWGRLAASMWFSASA